MFLYKMKYLINIRGADIIKISLFIYDNLKDKFNIIKR